VELTHSDSNPRLYLRLIILSIGGDVPVDSETLLVTDFVNLKIKPLQSFRGAYRDRVCVHLFIEMSARMCMSICACTVFLIFFCQIWFNFITYFYFTYAKRQKILFVTFILDPILENSWICFKLQCKVNLPLRTVEKY
jgi:hypothetical protein